MVSCVTVNVANANLGKCGTDVLNALGSLSCVNSDELISQIRQDDKVYVDHGGGKRIVIEEAK